MPGPALRDERFMRLALREAAKGIGKTSPNPAVGAVLVARDKVIARGHHRAAGGLHAEVECLEQVGGGRVDARATLYVTLEPCSTVGRTAACTEAIIKAGIRNVVIGGMDANPAHAGRAIGILKRAGVAVRTGVLADECDSLNEAFNKWIVTREPFVIAKCGMSLDGRLTRPATETRWLTGAQARRHAHGLRARVDAILVGAETVRADNPRLTVRGTTSAKQPWRVVMTRSGRLPRKAHVFADRFKDRTVTYRKKTLREVLRDLGRKEITSVLIEGGGKILGQALDDRLIDKLQIYIAPILTGGGVMAFGASGFASTAGAARLEGITYAQLGRDICVTAYPKFAARDDAG